MYANVNVCSRKGDLFHYCMYELNVLQLLKVIYAQSNVFQSYRADWAEILLKNQLLSPDTMYRMSNLGSADSI